MHFNVSRGESRFHQLNAMQSLAVYSFGPGLGMRMTTVSGSDCGWLYTFLWGLGWWVGPVESEMPENANRM